MSKGQEKDANPVFRQANKRGAARLAAVQALYQMEMTEGRLVEIVAEYEALRLGKEVDGDTYLEADESWFRGIVAGVVKNQKTIDPVIHSALPTDWPLSRLNTLIRSILRAGVFELENRQDVPLKVIITEYVEVAKSFFEDEEPKLINAVLDRIGKQSRNSGT